MYRTLKYAIVGGLALGYCGPDRPTNVANSPCEVDPAVGICHDPTPAPSHLPPPQVTIVCDPPGGGLFSICDITVVDGP